MSSSRPRDLPRPLNERQQRFVNAYLVSLNATQAYIQAGYKANTEKVAQVQGHRLLVKPSVQAAIQTASQKLALRAGITQERLIAEWAKLGFTEMGDYMTWGPHGMTLKDSTTLTPEQRAAVAEVSQTVTADGGGTIRLKLHDKGKALSEMSARLWPVPRDKEPSSGPVTNNVMVVNGDFDTEGYIELFRGFFDRSVVGVPASNGAHESLDTDNPDT